ncbi:unnamed protein product [Didymodactylos carnosus]|uniref:RRM domain-containing protein n=1 Tax=Didymodactylos carnosus TaxID=1234261 RepID=A0A816H143_9BILA|nr:unnamed protein product [Didymodactylos carnosus]CAF4685770.1 unnamed protein product [Didymodactylos carnosus]
MLDVLPSYHSCHISDEILHSKRIYISGVNKKLDEKQLHLYFEQYGKVLNCTILEHQNEAQFNYTKFSYVDFDNCDGNHLL